MTSVKSSDRAWLYSPSTCLRSFQLYWALVVSAGLFVLQEIVLLIMAVESHGGQHVRAGKLLHCLSRCPYCCLCQRCHAAPCLAIVAPRPATVAPRLATQVHAACPALPSLWPSIHVRLPRSALPSNLVQVKSATLGAYIFFADLATSFWFGILLAVSAGYWCVAAAGPGAHLPWFGAAMASCCNLCRQPHSSARRNHA